MQRTITATSSTVENQDGSVTVTTSYDVNAVTPDQQYEVTYLNGFVERDNYVRVFRQNNQLKIIVSGLVDIDQSDFTVGLVQTPLQFELDEATSRALYTQEGSSTAAGTIVAMPGLYYNDITYLTTVCGYLLKRVSENGNVYIIQFTNCELTAQSAMTALNWRVTLEL